MSNDGTSDIAKNLRYTIADYRQWPEGERWELIDGIAYDMSPAPRRGHQKLAGALFSALYRFLENHHCEVYIAPTDVFLPKDQQASLDEADTVVQPDVLVVCDPNKLIDEGILGAPDFVAEVLSPSTAAKDLEQKKDLYQRSGVKEYWIIRRDGSVFVWLLHQGRYLAATEYLPENPVPATVLPGFSWPPRSSP